MKTRIVAGMMIVFIVMSLVKFCQGLGWGLIVIGVDFYWLWIRTSLVRKTGTAWVSMMMTSGFLIRMISMVVFMRVADYYLSPDAFQKFTWMILTLPVWNLLEAVILGKGKMT